MYNSKVLENLKKGRKITSDNARALQKNSVKARKEAKTFEQMIKSLDEDGTVAKVFTDILTHGREENRVKLISLFSQVLDRATARKNGELDNKPAFVYQPMTFSEVGG